MSKPLGVGLLGAGHATQSIHLPVIASLADRLRVVKVMDIDITMATTSRPVAEPQEPLMSRRCSTIPQSIAS